MNEKTAKELLFTGRLISAHEAEKKDLINAIAEPEHIEKTVRDFAQKLIANCSGDSLKLTKQMIADIQSKPDKKALDYAAKTNATARSTDDCKRGISAFLNKEKIVW